MCMQNLSRFVAWKCPRMIDFEWSDGMGMRVMIDECSAAEHDETCVTWTAMIKASIIQIGAFSLELFYACDQLLQRVRLGILASKNMASINSQSTGQALGSRVTHKLASFLARTSSSSSRDLMAATSRTESGRCAKRATFNLPMVRFFHLCTGHIDETHP